MVLLHTVVVVVVEVITIPLLNLTMQKTTRHLNKQDTLEKYIVHIRDCCLIINSLCTVIVGEGGVKVE